MDMTRRGFLAGGAALGGLMASSALPVLADDPSLFPGRGRFERLSLNYHEIKAGASKPFTVLHISDTHLTAAYPDEGEWERKIAERRIRTFGGRQEEALRDSIAWAKPEPGELRPREEVLWRRRRGDARLPRQP